MVAAAAVSVVGAIMAVVVVGAVVAVVVGSCGYGGCGD